MEKFYFMGVMDLSMKQVDTIIRRDFSKDFNPASNRLPYIVCLSTWATMIADYHQPTAAKLIQTALEHGLKACIASASNCADRLVAGESIQDPLWGPLYYYVLTRKQFGYGFAKLKPLPQETDAIRIMNQLLKYPKRFSANDDKSLARACEEDFSKRQGQLLINERTKHPYSTSYVIELVKQVIFDMMPWEDLCEKLETSLANHEFRLTPGSARDAKPILASKLFQIAKYCPDALPGVFGYQPSLRAGFLGNPEDYGDTVKLCSVPKNYKTYRMIAMEDTWRAVSARALVDIIETYLPEGIKLRDQTFNQKLCLYASMTKSLATIDLSAASDSITRSIISWLFPERFVSIVNKVTPKYYETSSGQRRSLVSFATMGNPLTFIIECIVFYAANIAAEELYYFGNRPDPTISFDVDNTTFELPIPGVYGDDQIVRNDCYDTTVAILDHLGFTINMAKSYSGDSKYRESCGKEYYDGEDISAIYYPRHPIHGELAANALQNHTYRNGISQELTDSLTTLVSLQQRLMSFSVEAGRVASEIISILIPKMTVSPVGSHTPDLWGYSDTGKTFSPPSASIAHFVNKKTGLCEAERSMKLVTYVQHGNDTHATIEKLADRVMAEIAKLEKLLQGGSDQGIDTDVALATMDRITRLKAKLPSDEVVTLNLQKWVEDDCQAAIAPKFIKASFPPDVKDTRIRRYSSYQVHEADQDLIKLDEQHLGILQDISSIYLLNQYLKSGPRFEHASDTLEGKIERAAGITYNPFACDKRSQIMFGRPSMRWHLSEVVSE
nr:MAG: putative RNA-directed RNA polymerase [StochSlu_9 levi-like virus]